jgi:hypothetical protein
MGQYGLGLRSGAFNGNRIQFREPPLDPIRSELAEDIELPPAGRLCASISEVHNYTLLDAVDRGMRLIDEALQTFRKPVIAPGLAPITVHALLDNDPVTVIRNEEAMKIQIKPVLDRRAVHLGDEPARSREGRAVEPDAIADGDKLIRCPARMVATPAADMDAELL